MIHVDSSVEKIWSNYIKTLSDDEKYKTYTSWRFGGDKEISNKLAELVVNEEKIATTSLYYWYKLEQEPLPKVGDLNIITDYDGIAKCIIKINKVIVLPFAHVNQKFAFKEGEGDKSLDYWRKAHVEAFKDELKYTNIEFSDDMLVVCEEFEVVYK